MTTVVEIQTVVWWRFKTVCCGTNIHDLAKNFRDYGMMFQWRWHLSF